MDLLISSVGILLVKTKRGLPDADSASGGVADPLVIMIRSYLLTCLMGCVGFTLLCRSVHKMERRTLKSPTNVISANV